MDSHIGKSIHLSRLMRPSTGRGVIVAASHPILTGPLPAQRTLDEVKQVFPTLYGADAVMTTPGTLPHVADLYRGRGAPGLVMHMDWMNWYRPFYRAGGPDAQEGTVVSIATVEELAAAGVDGLMTYLYLGHDDTRLERDEVERNARLARECDKWGLVLIIEPQPAQDRRDPHARDPQQMAFYSRVAAELGADIVKSDLPAGPTLADRLEGFHEVASTSTAPVMLAGGPMESDEETIALAKGSVDAGGAGLVFGRKIYQSPDPAAMIRALNAVVHGEDEPA
jgi:DhnA family fructose-bisphosphate aldolase class Ia